MQTFLMFLHVFVCLMLVLTILLQPGKTPGMGGAFGGATSAGSFGAKSPTTVLSKITVVIAVGFMLSSLTLAWMSVRDHAVRLDLDEETHHPTPGLALPGDLSIDAVEAMEGEVDEAPARPEDVVLPADDEGAPTESVDDVAAGAEESPE